MDKSFLFRVTYTITSYPSEQEKQQVEYRLVYAVTSMQAERLLRKDYGMPIVCFNMTLNA